MGVDGAADLCYSRLLVSVAICSSWNARHGKTKVGRKGCFCFSILHGSINPVPMQEKRMTEMREVLHAG